MAGIKMVCGCGKIIGDGEPHSYDGEQFYCERCASQSQIGNHCKYLGEYCGDYRELCEKMPCNRVGLLQSNSGGANCEDK